MSHRRWARLALLGLVGAAAAIAGCGYALVGRASDIPDDVSRVYLAPFENETTRVQVEQFITEALAEELVTRRRFTLVESGSEADATIEGTVRSFRVTPITFDGEGRATEYEIAITASVDFARVGADETLWSNDQYLFKENYELDPSQAEFFDRENLAIEDTARRFAETMVSDLLEGF